MRLYCMLQTCPSHCRCLCCNSSSTGSSLVLLRMTVLLTMFQRMIPTMSLKYLIWKDFELLMLDHCPRFCPVQENIHHQDSEGTHLGGYAKVPAPEQLSSPHLVYSTSFLNYHCDLSLHLARVVYLTIQVWEQLHLFRGLPLKGNRLHVLCQIAVPHHQLAESWSCSHALMRILLWVHTSSKMSSMCGSSLLVSATSAKSSAYNTSCVQAVDGVLSWYVRKSLPPMV